MSANSIAGINVKIGADLKSLREEVGKVGDTVRESIIPAEKPVKDLSQDFIDVEKEASKASIPIGEIAQAVGQIGAALSGFVSGALKDALEVNPDTKENVDAIEKAFTEMKTAIGESIIPLIDKHGEKLTRLLKDVTQWIKENPDTAEFFTVLAGGIGVLGMAAGTALPIINAFNLSMISISATTLGVAGMILGFIVVLGYLSSTLDEIGQKASDTAEEIANMDTTTQKIVENGIGELEVVDIEVEFVPVWSEEANDFVEQWARKDTSRYDARTGEAYVWVPVEESVNQVTAAVTNMETATESAGESAAASFETANTSIDKSKSAAEQAEEVFQNMQSTFENLSKSSEEMDISDSMAQLTELYESDTFKELTQNPVDQTVTDSWQALGDSMEQASTGFTTLTESMEGEDALSGFQNLAAAITLVNNALAGISEDEEGVAEGAGTGLIAAFTSLPGLLDSTQGSAESLANYFNGDFLNAINTISKSMALIEIDEEGKMDASKGNTLHNALGAVKGVLEDIYTVSKRISDHWNGEFVSAVQMLKKTSGIAEGVLESLKEKALGAADGFNALAGAIMAVVGALDALNSAGASVNIPSPGGGLAEGGPAFGGTTYLVGEEGPELFTPNRNGYIIPNDELFSGEGRTIIVNVAFEGDVIGDEQTLTSYVSNACHQAIEEAVYAAV